MAVEPSCCKIILFTSSLSHKTRCVEVKEIRLVRQATVDPGIKGQAEGLAGDKLAVSS